MSDEVPMGDKWTEKLSDYIDGELNENDAVECENHLAECKECRETVEEIRAVVSRAATLEDGGPERDLWAGISEGIKNRPAEDSEVVRIDRKRRAGRRLSFSVPQLLAASIALIFVSAGSAWLVSSRSVSSDAPVAVETRAAGQAEVLFANFDDPGYRTAVATLERVLAEARGRLDSTTVEVLERSLSTIDQAIEEARAALQEDPSNHYLSEHLSATMNQKVRLLRQAARLATSAS